MINLKFICFQQEMGLSFLMINLMNMVIIDQLYLNINELFQFYQLCWRFHMNQINSQLFQNNI